MLHSVLLVDDELYARKGLRNLINWEACGYQQPDEADNGEDALELIRKHRYDLVITDIRMPVLDGLELIRKVREEKLDIAFIIVSGYNDFKYAQQAVRYGVVDFILKPIDEHAIEATITKLASKLTQDKLIQFERDYLLNNSIMTSLIKGEVSPQTVTHFAQRIGVKVDEPIYYIFIEVNDIHPWREDKAPSGQRQLEQIATAMASYIPDNKNIYLHVHRNRFGFILAQSQLESTNLTVGQFARSLQRLLSKRLNETIYIYIGSLAPRLLDLSESYRMAKEALLYKYAEDDEKTVVYDEVSKTSLNHVDLNGHLFRKLEEDFDEHNEEAVDEDIDVLFKEFKQKRYVPEAVKLAIHHCVSGILKAMKDVQIDESEIGALEPITSWQDLNISLDELRRLFVDFIKESGEALAKERKDLLKGGIQKVKSYIEANYQSNISLKSIASHFYMNPVYLGQLFKKSYGVFFNEYLLHIRVNEAKKLLRQTDMRIYEIAEKVGFSNSDYFVTQFEKIERMTPTEYRNSVM